MAELFGRSVYLLLILVVAKLTLLSWVAPAFVERWTRRYYEWVLRLLGYKVAMEPVGKGLLLWNRFAGPPVLILLLFMWEKMFGR